MVKAGRPAKFNLRNGCSKAHSPALVGISPRTAVAGLYRPTLLGSFRPPPKAMMNGHLDQERPPVSF
jgi:hypothetical protein